MRNRTAPTPAAVIKRLVGIDPAASREFLLNECYVRGQGFWSRYVGRGAVSCTTTAICAYALSEIGSLTRQEKREFQRLVLAFLLADPPGAFPRTTGGTASAWATGQAVLALLFSVARVAGFDTQKDLCVLKIDARDLPALPLGSSEGLRPGERVLVLGTPLGLEASVADGLLSGIRRLEGMTLLQFTAPVSAGNSGGPLLNLNGQVIGVVRNELLPGQNLNFALAIDDVKAYLRSEQALMLQQFRERTAPPDLFKVMEAGRGMQAHVEAGAQELAFAQAAEQGGRYEEALRHFETARSLCAGVGGSCLREAIEALRVIAFLGSRAMQAGEIAAAGSYGERGIRLMETAGGAEALLRQMQEQGMPDEGLQGFRKYTFAACYLYAGITAVSRGDRASAQQTQLTLRTLDAENALLLQEAIQDPTVLQQIQRR